MLVITFAFGIVITDNSLSIDYEGKRIFYPVGFIFAPDFFPRGNTTQNVYKFKTRFKRTWRESLCKA